MQLHTAHKSVKRERPANSGIIRQLFNVQSPHFTWTSRPTYSSETPDMTSPAAFDRHLSKLKTAENPASDGFGPCFSGEAFRLAQPISCLFV